MVTTIITQDKNDLINKLSSLIEKVANTSIKDENKFNIGVSGGSLVQLLALGLTEIKTDFSKWTVFFCDERVVPVDNPDSTFGLYKNELISKISLKEEQLIQIKQGVNAKEAAEDYHEKLMKICGTDIIPRFHMLLLGMGPDGHTCSLFPKHPLLEERELWVAPINDSPKPPPSRITLTYPVINNARYCVFPIYGEAKAEMVKRIVHDKEDLPATRVQPHDGKLFWILDKGAASLLPKEEYDVANV